MEETPPTNALAPLKTPVFRRIWFASLHSHLGFMFLSVGAAWQMTQLTPRADMVALVQTALMLPMMILSIPGGAIADMYDRRKVSLVSLVISASSATAFTLLTLFGLSSPLLTLIFCFLIGSGMALLTPAWQSSVREQVPAQVLPQAVALNGVSFNIARSVGPAIGGLLVAFMGSVAAFAGTALGYIPMIGALLLWNRTPTASHLPPERLDRAISAGFRYIIHSPPIRTVLIRAVLTGIGGCVIPALLPLVARDLLNGTAEIFGILLGCFGIGSVIGAMSLTHVSRHFSSERASSLASLILAGTIFVLAVSKSAILSGMALIIGGTCWTVVLTLYNILVQMSAPRWVSGRLLAGYVTAISGGFAAGSWLWGHVATQLGLEYALFYAAALLSTTPLVAMLFRIPTLPVMDLEPVKLNDPEVNLDLTGRSGPIVLELEYCVPQENAREFYHKMLAVRTVRNRNGAFGWSISRDIKYPELWVERFSCPTWHDYLRQRDRNTADEVTIFEAAQTYMNEGCKVEVRRLLERPFGSVRWRDDAPQP